MRNLLPELYPASANTYPGDVVIEPTLKGAAAELLMRAGFAGKRILLVTDTNTHKVLGERLMRELSALKPQLLMLEDKPYPDEETVDVVRAHTIDAVIAVGSGTISDICKYATYQDKKPYVMFPTAPSMNGYLSANASIVVKGHKKTLAAHLPKAVFCDLDIIAAAPKRLILSGLGDSLCRPTAQADWLLSHLLLDTPYNTLPFELLKPYEKELFAHSGKLAGGDLAVVEMLMKALLVSGLGMVIAGGSYPASQGEHLIAHTMEMKHGAKLPETYHGEQIGVTTLTMAKIQEEILSRPLELKQRAHWEKTISAYFGSGLAASVNESSHSKHLLPERYGEINAMLEKEDKSIREQIRSIAFPENTLRGVLEKAGAPIAPQKLGWNERDYELAVSHARFIRDRFTFLDLL